MKNMAVFPKCKKNMHQTSIHAEFRAYVIDTILFFYHTLMSVIYEGRSKSNKTRVTAPFKISVDER